MTATLTAERVEERLRDQLERDARKPSRRTVDGDTILINPSGTAAGMAYALEQMTGEPWDQILSRIIESLPVIDSHIPKARPVDEDQVLLRIQQHFTAMPYGGLCHFSYADTSRDRLSLEQIADNLARLRTVLEREVDERNAEQEELGTYRRLASAMREVASLITVPPS